MDLGVKELGPGTVVADAFRIESPLSAGGMGSVYVATQLQTDRKRALKLMHPELARDEKFRERFVREARVGAQIESEHVVEVLDAGVDEQLGMPWLAMELLEGQDLAALVNERGPLPPAQVSEIYVQLCHALSAAHAVGVVHRDLKPENLFLARSRRADADTTLKILDFGIAKVVEEVRTKSAATASIGTPLWMAPEQTVPGAKVSAATDVWPLGLIAYFLLTGGYFWKSAHSEASTPMMLLRELAMEPIPPASQRATELGCADKLPSGFDAWFARCVAQAPEQRFPSVDVALQAMLPVLRGAANASANGTGLESPSANFATAGSTAVGHTVPATWGTAGPGPTLSSLAGTPQAAAFSGIQPEKSHTVRNFAVVAALVVVGGLGLAGALAFRSPETTSTDEADARPRRRSHAAPSASAASSSSTDASAAVVVPDASAAPSAEPLPSAATSAAPLPSAKKTSDAPGKLPPEVIQRVVRARFPAYRACYQAGLSRNPNLQGRVNVKFVISPTGSVSSATGSGDIPDAAVISCVAAAFRTLTFPPPEGGGVVRVSYPIVFTPSG